MGRLRGVRVKNACWGRGLQKQRRTEAHTAPVINDLLGGQVDILCDQTTSTSRRVAPEPMERCRARGSRNDEAAVLSCAGIPDQAQSLFAGGSLKRDIHTDPGYPRELKIGR